MFKLNYYILSFLLSIVLMACSDGGSSNQWGFPISNRKAVPIAELFDNTSRYDGKTVILKGVIDMQDPNGYWFYMQDGEARIYVEVYNAGFSIPDVTQKTVLAEGLIEVKLNIPSLLATGVVRQQ